jgi:general L-amino acid transport system permease protein
MGLGYWRSMGLVILPQALKLVIPGIVNTFIALFKDTSLVIIIGLFDLLNSVKQAAADPTGWAWPRRLCVRRPGVLDFLFRYVPLLHAFGAQARHWPQALGVLDE